MFNLDPDDGYTLHAEKILLSYSEKQLLDQLNLINADMIKTNQLPFLIHCLTLIMHEAVKKDKTLTTSSVLILLSSLAKNHPTILLDELRHCFSVGKLKGSSLLYLWLHDFCLETYNKCDQSYLKGIIKLFTMLQSHPNFKDLSPSFTENLEGRETTALWVLTQGLLHATKQPFCFASAINIAKFYEQTLTHLNQSIFLSAIEQIIDGPYRNKSILYFLACTLKEAARTKLFLAASLVDSVEVLCNLFKKMNELYPNEFLRTLKTPINVGEYEGFTPLHIILHALIAASYIDHNQKAIDLIVSVLENIIKTQDQEKMAAIFAIPILTSREKFNTGIELLKTAREKASYSHIETTQLDRLIAHLEPEAELSHVVALHV